MKVNQTTPRYEKTKCVTSKINRIAWDTLPSTESIFEMASCPKKIKTEINTCSADLIDATKFYQDSKDHPTYTLAMPSNIKTDVFIKSEQCENEKSIGIDENNNTYNYQDRFTLNDETKSNAHSNKPTLYGGNSFVSVTKSAHVMSSVNIDMNNNRTAVDGVADKKSVSKETKPRHDVNNTVYQCEVEEISSCSDSCIDVTYNVNTHINYTAADIFSRTDNAENPTLGNFKPSAPYGNCLASNYPSLPKPVPSIDEATASPLVIDEKALPLAKRKRSKTRRRKTKKFEREVDPVNTKSQIERCIPVKLEENTDKYEKTVFVSQHKKDRNKSIESKSHERLSCTLCNGVYRFSTPDVQTLEVHIAEHLSGRLTCHICNTKFSQRFQLREHMQMEHTSAAFTCEVCSLPFFTYSSLQRHLCIKHTMNTYPCKKCKQKFLNMNAMKEHVYQDHGTAFKCADCGTIFLIKKYLKLHQEKGCMTGYTLSKCEHCSKWLSKSQLQNHIKRVHLKVHMYKCEECAYTTPARTSLNDHIRTHNGKYLRVCLSKNHGITTP